MKRPDSKAIRTVTTAIILALVKIVLSISSKSVCSFTFYQPPEPNNIEDFLKRKDCWL